MSDSARKHVYRDQTETLVTMIQPETRPHTTLLNSLLAGYLVFVVYGSLVPLNYVHRDLDIALAAFLHLPWLDLSVHSRADWVANALLFMPLTFLVAARLEAAGTGRPAQLALASLFSVLLAVAVEFSQTYFPPRTVSQNDIVAEAIGGLTGVILWRATGRQAQQLLAMLAPHSEADAKRKATLALYALALFIYNVMPLDLTLSAAELHEKWKAGRIILNPLTHMIPGSPTGTLEIGIDLAMWAVFALLACQAFPGPETLRRNVLLAGAPWFVEAAQLFVFTRVTDSADIVVGLLGVLSGRLLARRFGVVPIAGTNGNPPVRYEALRGIAFVPLLSVLTALPFLYPFDFSADLAAARERLVLAAGRTLFETYYFGTEYRALTEVLHKFVPFFAFGALVTAFVPLRRKRLQRLVVMALGVSVAGAVECLQIFLPGKFPDLTDLLLESLGAYAGTVFWQWRSCDARPAEPPPSGTNIRPGARISPLATALLAMAAALAFVFGPMHSYNVRELLPSGIGRQMLAVPLVLLAFGFPAYTLLPLEGRSGLARPVTHLLFWLAIAIAMQQVLPQESIDDIIGSGRTYDTVMERPFRTFFTLSVWFVPGAMALQLGLRESLPRAGNILAALLLIACNAVLAYLVIVAAARTDNVTELLSSTDHPLPVVALSASAFCIALSACILIRLTRTPALRKPLAAATLLAALAGLAFMLTDLALERYVIKYGQAFPALQFLLTGTRSPQMSTLEILPRFLSHAFAFAALIAVSCNINTWISGLLRARLPVPLSR